MRDERERIARTTCVDYLEFRVLGPATVDPPDGLIGLRDLLCISWRGTD